MATTLANLRAKLNGELNVTSDPTDTIWSLTVRNNAISDGYAELWRVGVWKPVKQDLASVDAAGSYALTNLRALERIEVRDSTGVVNEIAKGRIEADGSGGTQLTLTNGLAAGFTVRVRGWTAYKSVFSGDSDTDDLDAEYNRIPLLKAKAICLRMVVAQFSRYGIRESVPPEMNVSLDGLLAAIRVAELEFTEEAHRLAGLRPRPSQIQSLN